MSNDNIDIESLLVFATVVREKSFSNAADVLKRSRQSIHRQIKTFEENLSVKLFKKVNRGVVPTTIGLRLFEVAERILDEASTAVSLVKQKDGESRLRIRMTAPPLLAEAFLSSSISQIVAMNRGLQIDCQLSNDFLDLREHNIDIAFRIGQIRRDLSKDYSTIPLGSAKRIIVASPAYLKKHGLPRTIKDLNKHRILYFGNLNEYQLGVWPLKTNYEFRPALSASSPHLIFDAVLKGSGIAMLPEMLCAPMLQKGRIESILPDMSSVEIPVNLIHRTSLKGTRFFELFLEKILQDAREADWLNYKEFENYED